MLKEKYNNKEYNPFVYPEVSGHQYSNHHLGITLFDQYVGQVMQSRNDYRGNMDGRRCHKIAEELLNARAEMLGIKIFN